MTEEVPTDTSLASISIQPVQPLLGSGLYVMDSPTDEKGR